MTPQDFEQGFQRVEAAIDAHGYFTRIPTVVGEPCAHVSREGVRIEIRVKAPRRRRPEVIHGSGATIEEACQDLADSLEIWRAVVEKK